VYVTLRCPETGLGVDNFPAELDTGADRTVIPAKVAKDLKMQPLRQLAVAGLGADVRREETFLVQLAIRGLGSLDLEVLGVPGESYVLLGRDVLNRYRILLDGPNLALEISEP
jgi:hypothetical protein